MARDYKQIGKKIALTGFFSEYLPPCFSLNSKVLNRPPVSDCDLIPPYSFTMSRFNGNDSRRAIFIPEIGAYLAAYNYMSENNIIQELVEYSQTDRHAFSHILSDVDDSIMRHEQVYSQGLMEEDPSTSVYMLNIGEKLIRAAGAKKILKLDISNCYASFYMHMIPAIMLGYESAEQEYRKFSRNSSDPSVSPIYLRYRKLDEAIRRQNLNRTNGLLPGILFSRIIAEAILTRIDQELDEHGLQFVRYVDDYEVFLYDNDEQKAVGIFSEVIKRYGFSLNAEKTTVIDFPFYVVENFEGILGSKLDNPIPCDCLIDIFNSFFKLEQQGTKGAIRYLLKRFEKQPPNMDMPEIYKAYLLTIMANNERSLSKSCAILISHKDDLPLSDADQKIVRSMLITHLRHKHDLEVLWLLYLLIETRGIEQCDPLIADILANGPELALVLLLRRELLTPEQISTVKVCAGSWLLLYELYVAEVISEDEFSDRLNLSKNLPMYQKFKRDSIHFVS